MSIRTPSGKNIRQHFNKLNTIDDIYNCVFANTDPSFNSNFYVFKQTPYLIFEEKFKTLMETENIGDMDALYSKVY